MSPLPNFLYSAASVRELDRIAIEEAGIPGLELMSRAGTAVYHYLRTRWPDARKLVVLCGGGNNGGDGYVIARLAQADGMTVQAIAVGERDTLTGDALTHAQRMEAAGLQVTDWQADCLVASDVIVDALLGTGLDREVSGRWLEVIDAINHCASPVLAVDIPSGLAADSGAVMGVAVEAAATVTFIGVKTGLLTGSGPQCCGTLVFDDLAVPDSVYERVTVNAKELSIEHYAQWLKPRPRDAHKGHFGHVVVVGGDLGYPGAPFLAGESAARVGAGKISIITRPEHINAMVAGHPELMVHGMVDALATQALFESASVIAVGPGLGQSDWSREMLGAVLRTGKPLVVDADALNLLAQDPLQRGNWILTPHPGEASRLLAASNASGSSDRIADAQTLQQFYAGVLVLKGAGTIVIDDDQTPGICRAGNPGMASGGMGDALTGVIAGLVAQGVPLTEAAGLGVCLHSEAADRAVRVGGERGLLAGDLMQHLRNLVNPVSSL